MQSVSSRIWTRVAVSNSYDDNLYTISGVHIFPNAISLKMNIKAWLKFELTPRQKSSNLAAPPFQKYEYRFKNRYMRTQDSVEKINCQTKIDFLLCLQSFNVAVFDNW